MMTKIIFIVSILTNIGESYFRGTEEVNYPAAKSYCESFGTTLASIVTVTEFNDAVTECGSVWNCFIGLRDDLNGNDDMIFAWDDGSDIGTSYGFNADGSPTTGEGPWAFGEPNEFIEQPEDCVQIQSGKYNDVQCDVRYAYPLCNDIDAGTTLPSQYFKGTNLVNYDNAAAYCQSQGTTLASIVSESEYNVAKSVCGSANNCIIGLKDDITEGIWSWSDGTDITTSYGFNNDGTATASQLPWGGGEPNNSGNKEDCVIIRGDRDGTYNDIPCEAPDFYPLCNGDPLETISFGEVKYGSITSYNKKYYEIILTEEEDIYFETCGSGYDTYLYFYDSNLNEIDSCDDCGYHGPSCGYQGDLVISNVLPGTYYVAVGGYSSEYGSFKLSMAQGALSCGGLSVIGDIVSYGQDYYRIDLDSSYQQIFIEACNTGTNYDTYLTLYDENMNVMNECDDCQDHNGVCIDGYQGDLTEDNIPAGTYFVGISGYSSSYGNYELTLTCDDNQAPTSTAAIIDCEWDEYLNTQGWGLTHIPSATSLEECQAACCDDINCNDVNWDPYEERKCWIGTATSLSTSTNWHTYSKRTVASAKSVYHDQISFPDNENNNNYNSVDNNNNGMNSIEINSNILWIICGLMILNIICLTIYCMNVYNNKKEKGYKVVGYESEDAQLV